jgi:hypothetical protein
MRYSGEWKSTVERMGRWIDFDTGYKTLDTSYMESVWWVFGQLWEKGQVYRGLRVMPYSTGCTTPLSNFEAGEDYRDVNDPTGEFSLIHGMFRLTFCQSRYHSLLLMIPLHRYSHGQPRPGPSPRTWAFVFTLNSHTSRSTISREIKTSSSSRNSLVQCTRVMTRTRNLIRRRKRRRSQNSRSLGISWGRIWSDGDMCRCLTTSLNK